MSPKSLGLLKIAAPQQASSRKARRKEERRLKKCGRGDSNAKAEEGPRKKKQKQRNVRGAKELALDQRRVGEAEQARDMRDESHQRARPQVSLATAALLGRPATADNVARGRTLTRARSEPPQPSGGLDGRLPPRSSDPLIQKEAEEIAYLERKLGLRKKGGQEKLRREFEEEDGYDAEFGAFLESLDDAAGRDANRRGDTDSAGEPLNSGRRRPRFSSFDAIEGSDGNDDDDDDDYDDDDDDDDDDGGGDYDDDDYAEEEAAFAAAVAAQEVGNDGIDEFPNENGDDSDDSHDGVVHSQRPSRNLDVAIENAEESEVEEDSDEEGIDNAVQALEIVSQRDPDIVREEAEIAYLERKLGLNKTGGTKRFYDEIETEEFGEGFGNFLQELEDLSSRVKERHTRGMNSTSENVVAIYGQEDSDERSESDDEPILSKQEMNTTASLGNSVDKQYYRPSHGEDIYGRKTAENGTHSDAAQKYVPPGRRNVASAAGAGHDGALSDSAARIEHVERLRRKVTGALNRLAEGTLEHCARELLPLFASSSALASIKKKTSKKKPFSSNAHATTVAYAASDVTDVVTEAILNTCISDTQLLKGLVPAAAALVCSLHTLLRSGGGSADYGYGADLFAATFVERVAAELQKVLEGETQRTWSSLALESDDGSGGAPGEKELTSRRGPNLVLLVAAIYNLGLVRCQLVYGLVASLVRRIGDGKENLEMLLFLLREIGPRLRSDDPSALQDIVKLVQETKLSKTGEWASTEQSNRVRFMEEELDLLRKAKPSFQKSRGHLSKSASSSRGPLMDADSLQRMRKMVMRLRINPRAKTSGKASSTAGSGFVSLHMSWDDLVQAETKGRWWRTGASWAGLAERANAAEALDADEKDKARGKRTRSNSGDEMAAESSLEAAASRQRMNTDARRAVFTAIMGAGSVDDACHRLGDIGHGAGHGRRVLKGNQEREVVRVLMECCGQEASYNPFYAALMRKLCSINSEHRFTLQLAFWDEFKQWDASEIGNNKKRANTRRAANLAKFLASLVVFDVLSLPSVLKPVDLSDAALSPIALLFFRACFATIVQADTSISAAVKRGEGTLPFVRACGRLGASTESLLVRDQIVVFVSRHLKAPPPGLSPAQVDVFSKNRKRFEKALGDAQRLHKAATKQ